MSHLHPLTPICRLLAAGTPGVAVRKRSRTTRGKGSQHGDNRKGAIRTRISYKRGYFAREDDSLQYRQTEGPYYIPRCLNWTLNGKHVW